MKTVYLDNAATTHPKPELVYQAHDRFFRDGGSPGRSGHHLALAASKKMFDARMSLAELLGIDHPDRIVFTPGCTYSVNFALFGIAWNPGDIVLVSALEHNAVMRPLAALAKQRQIQVKIIPYSAEHVVDINQLQSLIAQYQPALCVIQEGSNVTGQRIDLAAIDRLCSSAGVPLMVDAAQTAGLFHTSLRSLSSVAYWCASGHKGLLGAAGSGVLYVKPGFDLAPLISGGTGSRSEHLDMPLHYPDRLEPGTQAGPAIAALGAGAAWLLTQDRVALSEHELSLTKLLISRLEGNEHVRVIAANAALRLPVVSFSIKHAQCSYVAEVLDREFGICVRSGLHCAVTAHDTLGTVEDGLVRVSFGHFNSVADVDLLCEGIAHVCNSLVR